MGCDPMKNYFEEEDEQRKEEEKQRWLRKKALVEVGDWRFSVCLVCGRRLNSPRTQFAGLCFEHIDSYKASYDPDKDLFFYSPTPSWKEVRRKIPENIGEPR